MTDRELFDKVLFIGPDHKGNGGISSVLKSYHDSFPVFHYAASNSRHGTLAGLVRVGLTMLRMPVERLRGRRIMHIHGAMGKSWIRKGVITRLGRMLGFKSIFHCHGCTTKEYFEKIGHDAAGRGLARHDAVIALSDYWVDYFSDTFGIRDKVYRVDNIVAEPEGIGPDAKRADGPLRILFFGQLGARKGIFDILDAISTHNLRGFKLFVGGNGEVERFKREIRERGLEDRVEYVGWVTGDTKDRLLRDCDVLMLPSYNEGLPIAILEAMSYGDGIISTPVGGIPEVIDDGLNGLLVTPGNIDEIADAMRAYIADPSLAGRHGAVSVRRMEPFYPRSVIRRLSGIYRALLG